MPATPPEPSVPPCVPVHGGDCITPEAFEQSAAELVDGYRLEDNFKNQWGLDHIQAGLAYGNLKLLKGEDAKPGSGVTIGFIDTGIDQSHPVFAGKTVTEQFLSGASDETGARYSHGTAVASVAAAIPTMSSSAPQGVAWGADIAMFSIPTGSSGGGGYNDISLAGLAGADARWAGYLNHVLAWRDGVRKVDFLNLSVSYRGIIDSYSERDLRQNFGSAIAAMAQAGASEKTVLVWAAGNAHGKLCDLSETGYCENGAINAVSTEVLPGLAARIPELRSHMVAVVALSPTGEIASFSNRCGIVADFCIAAPGEEVTVAYFGSREGDIIRSFATPRERLLPRPWWLAGWR